VPTLQMRTFHDFSLQKCRKYEISKLIFENFSGSIATNPLMCRGYGAPPHILPLLAAPSGPLGSPSALPGNEADL